MDEIKADADKYKIALDKYFETVSEKFQSAAATVVATLLHSKGPILSRIIMTVSKYLSNAILYLSASALISSMRPFLIIRFNSQHCWLCFPIVIQCSKVSIKDGKLYR
jgi:hypothetical protein